MKLIALTGKKGYGKFAQVDDEDYEHLMQWKWHYGAGYARRTGQETKEGKQSFWCILMHRVIMKIVDSRIIIDHKDGNPLNNQKSNLRTATPSGNGANRQGWKNSTSKYLGVSNVKINNKWYWRACCRKNYKYKIISCKTEIEAALQYNEWAKELHGEFAKLNIIPEEDIKTDIEYRKSLIPKKDVKICAKCKKELSREKFNKTKTKRGMSAYCTSCNRIRCKEWHIKKQNEK